MINFTSYKLQNAGLEEELPRCGSRLFYWIQKSLLVDDKILHLIEFADGLLYSFVDDYVILMFC
jgi:hypothetical protein